MSEPHTPSTAGEAAPPSDRSRAGARRRPPLLPARPHAEAVVAVLRELKVDPARGLPDHEVSARRQRYGENRLTQRPAKPLWRILADQLRSLLVWLLAAAAALSFFVGDHAEGVAILVVILLNTAIGFTAELRAARSMEALRRMAAVRTRVRRNGGAVMVDARALVPGDVVIVEAGDVVTADLRLISAAALACDESVLTGESAPVAKSVPSLAAETLLAERTNMVFKGSLAARGAAEGVVVATGMETELGRISKLAEEAAPQASPLERRLDRLGDRLIWLTLGLTAAIALAGIAQGRGVIEMLETAIALAVAATPEGLPVVATLCLARGMLRMARRNALISRLSAVETLGATTLILTDKTGTLTENRMTATRYLLEGAEAARAEPEDAAAYRFADENLTAEDESPAAEDERLLWALRVGALCTNAELSEHPSAAETDGAGDPMELALLAAARAARHTRAALERRYPPMAQHPFDDGLKMMATLHRDGDAVLFAVKGAPERVLERCARSLGAEGPEPLDAAARAAWAARLRETARRGYRLLGLAFKHEETAEADPFADLTWIGAAALSDPVRDDVPEAIAACRAAGVRVTMVTGDHADTAAEIARQAGLGAGDFTVMEGRALVDLDLDALSEERRAELRAVDVFARVAPETKLQLARLHQQAGEIVAMTGDGVNDAPALKQADIGVAMGLRGSDAAREAAAMVLKDDRFPTLVSAIREGRVIFDNIRRAVVYLLSCNLSEILLVGVAVVMGLPAPLAPLQILFLNLVTDVAPAFALGLGEGDEAVMRRPPRDPAEPIVTRADWIFTGLLGAVIALATLGAYLTGLYGLGLSHPQAITVTFLTIALAQLWNAFNMRDPDAPMLVNDVTASPYVWIAILVSILLLAAAMAAPFLAALLELPWPGWSGMLAALGFSLTPLLVGQGFILWRNGRRA